MKTPSFVIGFLAVLGTAAAAVPQSAQPGHYGIFTGATDIGVTYSTSTDYDAAANLYRIAGGGADLWGTADAFHLDWVRLAGDAAISADIQFPDHPANPLAKAVLMFRQSLDPNSAYADVAIHADGHITLQYRTAAGAQTADITAPQHSSRRIEIRRHGNEFTASALAEDGKMIPFASYTVPLTGQVYVGAGVCSHDPGKPVTVTFSNLSIERFAY